MGSVFSEYLYSMEEVTLRELILTKDGESYDINDFFYEDIELEEHLGTHKHTFDDDLYNSIKF